MLRKDTLNQAQKLVCGLRDEEYGNPENNFATIAGLWNEYLKKKPQERGETVLNAADIAAMMILLKVARISSGHSKADNWVDIAGYAACGGELETKERIKMDELCDGKPVIKCH